MKTMDIHNNGAICLSDIDVPYSIPRETGLHVRQARHGTEVYWSPTFFRPQAPCILPHKRYSLAADRPLPGNPGRAEFEADIRQAITYHDQLPPVLYHYTDPETGACCAVIGTNVTNTAKPRTGR